MNKNAEKRITRGSFFLVEYGGEKRVNEGKLTEKEMGNKACKLPHI